MLAVGVLLLYLGIARKYEPLLLIPIGFGAILVNLPLTGLIDDGGLLRYFYFGIESGIFPPLIFLGIGALTDFGPLLAQPRTFLLGAAAQFGIFATLIGARALGFSFAESASIAIIGGADGPTAIFLTSRLADHLLGPIAVAAYSYMALVPVIQPPIIRLLTTRTERMVVMGDVKPVSRRVKIVFPIATTIVAGLVIPASVPLIGMLMLGNLLRESGVANRLSQTAQNELINIVTIFLGTAIGSRMDAAQFLTVQTLMIIGLGLVAFSIGTAAGVLLGKLMYLLSGGKVNPMIGAAGVSAVPMAARVVQKVGQEENPKNFLLMHAMGPNVAGVIGSAVAAGILLALGG
ncbi:MAG: sodium ion-translocating decarboxylase subunit beta [Spirochaetaceae bacterium]|nr:MAG: sodium ion-translocating decarboxylase subunit beta [Spirochaetaceae bacterium]